MWTFNLLAVAVYTTVTLLHSVGFQGISIWISREQWFSELEIVERQDNANGLSLVLMKDYLIDTEVIFIEPHSPRSEQARLR
jgi:hypothetical protein